MKYINSNGKEIYLTEEQGKTVQELNEMIMHLERGLQQCEKSFQLHRENPKIPAFATQEMYESIKNNLDKLLELRSKYLQEV